MPFPFRRMDPRRERLEELRRQIAELRNELAVLETSTGNPGEPPFFVPGSGRVVRVTADGELEVVATGLNLPTAMEFGPDGTLYVSNYGFGFPPGAGEIVTVDVTAAP